MGTPAVPTSDERSDKFTAALGDEKEVGGVCVQGIQVLDEISQADVAVNRTPEREYLIKVGGCGRPNQYIFHEL